MPVCPPATSSLKNRRAAVVMAHHATANAAPTAGPRLGVPMAHLEKKDDVKKDADPKVRAMAIVGLMVRAMLDADPKVHAKAIVGQMVRTMLDAVLKVPAMAIADPKDHGPR